MVKNRVKKGGVEERSEQRYREHSRMIVDDSYDLENAIHINVLFL